MAPNQKGKAGSMPVARPKCQKDCTALFYQGMSKDYDKNEEERFQDGEGTV